MKLPTKTTRYTFRADADVRAAVERATSQPGVIRSKIINHLLRLGAAEFAKKRDK